MVHTEIVDDVDDVDTWTRRRRICRRRQYKLTRPPSGEHPPQEAEVLEKTIFLKICHVDLVLKYYLLILLIFRKNTCPSAGGVL